MQDARCWALSRQGSLWVGGVVQCRRSSENGRGRIQYASLVCHSARMQLADLLGRMTALDPERRISPAEALQHPFIVEPLPAAAAGGAEG